MIHFTLSASSRPAQCTQCAACMQYCVLCSERYVFRAPEAERRSRVPVSSRHELASGQRLGIMRHSVPGLAIIPICNACLRRLITLNRARLAVLLDYCYSLESCSVRWEQPKAWSVEAQLSRSAHDAIEPDVPSMVIDADRARVLARGLTTSVSTTEMHVASWSAPCIVQQGFCISA